MFIVKAEDRSKAYSMYEAERVRVVKSTIAGTDPKPYPELEVWLYDASGHEKAILYVGHGLDHYSHVYIMNERGKTVDSVYPGPQPATQGNTTATTIYASGTSFTGPFVLQA